MKSLNSIVHGFMARWLLLPAVVCLAGLTALRMVMETRQIERSQQYYARTIEGHVRFYLKECSRDLVHLAGHLQQDTLQAESVKDFVRRNVSFRSVYLLGRDGRVLNSRTDKTRQKDFSGLISGEIPREGYFMTVPYYSGDARTIVVGMVRAVSKDLLVMAELSLAALQESVMELTRYMENGFVFLTDAYGNVIAHPDKSMVERQVNMGGLEIISSVRENRVKSGFYKRPDGWKMMSAAGAEDGKWKVVVNQDALELFEPALVTFLLSIPVMAGLFFVLAFLFNRRLYTVIIAPLARFTHEIDSLKKGGPEEIPYEKSGPDRETFVELASLRENFNEMQATVISRETALRQSEEKYRILVDNASDGVFVAQDRVMKFANPKMESITGYTVNELARMPFADMIHPDDREWVVLRYQKGLAGENPTSPYSFKIFRKTGETLTVQLNTVLIQWEGRKATLNFLRDITRWREMENQLFQSQKMESVGRLAGGVAHDFNNMLNIIQGHTQLALMDAEPEAPVVDHLEQIDDAAKRSADLTRQLLAFARRQTAEPKVVDLNSTISGMLKMLQRLIGEEIELVWRPGKNLCRTRVDPAQVDQIMANLCVNAKDAISGVGEILIETRTIVLDENDCAEKAGLSPGTFALITVSDNGAGMDPATLERIFEPFFTTKGSGEGTGLGMATVYGIVKQNGGYIDVHSEPGQGTTFQIYLPESEEPSQEQEPSSSLTVAAGSETVLLVEDEGANLEMVETVLGRYGYTVISANSPSQALEKARRHPGSIDLVLTDVVMPQMNGKQLKEELEKTRPKIVVLFMSGYTQNVIMKSGILEDQVHFIQKPFSVEEIAAKVRKVLDHPGGPKSMS